MLVFHIEHLTDIYERLADENEPAPATAPTAQLTGEQASELMSSLMAEDSNATAILSTLAGQASICRTSSSRMPAHITKSTA